MRKTLLALLYISFCISSHSQTNGSIIGRIIDGQTKEKLAGATVIIKNTSFATVSNNEGSFEFNQLDTGSFVLVISFVGYIDIELQLTVIAGRTADVDVNMTPDEKPGNILVISASRRPEKITSSPATVRVITKKELEQFAGSNIYELASTVEGLEFVRSGIDYVSVNARGFNRASNNKVLQITDNRNSMTPISIGLPTYNYSTVNKEDVERIEFVLGPQSALYGPNAHNAVINTIMKDPRKFPGATLVVSGGNHYQFSSRLRYAEVINKKWAYKLTGEYITGRDFSFYDSVYAGNQPGTPPLYGSAVAIPERNVNFNFRRLHGEAHVYFSMTPKIDIIVSGGASNNNSLGVANGGRNQMRGVSIGFLQGRIVHPHFFATVYETWGNIGTSYSISSYTRDFWNVTHTIRPLPPDSAEIFAMRPGNQFKEINQRINAEAQYNYYFPRCRLFLITGMSYQKEKPNSYGYSLVDKDNRIIITQTGGVLQLEKNLPWKIRLIGAARLDHHSNFGNLFSPKLALAKSVDDQHFRITWAKAYATPNVFFQYANSGGVTFGNGPGIRYLPNGPVFDDHRTEKITIPLKPEEISTWEIGYKGSITKKLFADINGYYGLSKNFLSPPQSVLGRALSVGDIPVNPTLQGKIENDSLKAALFSSFFNYGDVTSYGLDAGLNYLFSSRISLAIKYSWFGSDITKDDLKNDANNDKFVSLEETSLNAPVNRTIAALSFQNLCRQKLFLNISARFVESYDFYSGSQIATRAGKGSRGKVFWGNDPNTGQPRYYLKNFDRGPLGGFTSIDLAAGYRMTEMIQLNLGITNLFDSEQMEFAGSPSIGRLIVLEFKVQVPTNNKK